MNRFTETLCSIFVLVLAGLISVSVHASDPLIKRPVFACGSGANSKQADPGAFRANGSRFGYTFDRSNETVFEGGQVKPIALSPSGNLLFVANTPANCLEIYDTRNDKLQLVSSVRVGVEPVSLAARSENEVWVVNHISDSVSVVNWNNTDGSVTAPQVRDTLLVGDEPRDIVFGDSSCTENGTNAKNRAFITTAYRGQHHPIFNPDDLLTDQNANGPVGRASVFVFDASSPHTSSSVIPLFSMPARALAATPDGCTVYAAALLSGNQTTLTINTGGVGSDTIGLLKRAIFGSSQESTTDGLISIATNVIVKFVNGKWIDGVTGADWTSKVGLNLPDNDVYAINVSMALTDPAGSRTSVFHGVGTTLFNMAVNPVDKKIYVSNFESRNDKRYVGDPVDALPTLRGHFIDHRITTLDPVNTAVAGNVYANLNDHITDFMATSTTSMAQPTDMVVTADGSFVYVANFGSRTVSRISTSVIESPAPNSQFASGVNAAAAGNNTIHMETLANQQDSSTESLGVKGGGPAGLALGTRNAADDRLYIYTRFDNAISVLDVSSTTPTILSRVKMQTPESNLVKQGRPFLYDATISSKNGTGSCGGCHIYGDMDMLAWDLGKPTGAPAFNALNHSILSLDPDQNRFFQGFVPMVTNGQATYGGLGKKDMAFITPGQYYLDVADVPVWEAQQGASEFPDVYLTVNGAQSQWAGGPGEVWQVYRTNVSSSRLNPTNADPILPGMYICIAHSPGEGNEPEITSIIQTTSGTCSDGQRPYFVKWVNCGTSAWFAAGVNPPDASGVGCVPAFADYHPSEAVGNVYTDVNDWVPNGNDGMLATMADAQGARVSQREVLVEAWSNFMPNTITISIFTGATIAEGGKNDGNTQNVTKPFNSHPLKGPMTTQTLRGIADSGPLHWRGDKSGGDGIEGGGHCLHNGVENCTGTADAPQEKVAFKQFNEAFVGLLGKDPVAPGKGLSDAQMDAFAEFVLRLTPPPNPIVNLDNTLPTNNSSATRAADGQTMFNIASGTEGASSLFTFPGQQYGANCNACHALDRSSNLFGTDKSVTFETREQFIKVPHLRNAYQKVGMFFVNDQDPQNGSNWTHRDQVAGFGYGHDGMFDTLVDFFNFQFSEVASGGGTIGLTRDHARNLAMFMMAFDTNVMPIVGQSVTLNPSDVAQTQSGGDITIQDPSKAAQLNVIFNEALVTHCNLVQTNVIKGAAHIYPMKGSAENCANRITGVADKVCFSSDYVGSSPNNGVPSEFSDAITRSELLAGDVEQVTFTCLPTGSNPSSSTSGDSAYLNEFAPVLSPETTIEPAPSGDQITWHFSPSITASSLFLTNANGDYPRHIQIYGSNQSGVIVAADELLTDVVIPSGISLNAATPDIQVKLSASGTQFAYYKLLVLDSQLGACNGNCAANVSGATWSRYVDLDGDGVPYPTDQFPNNPAASIDSDGDGHPDSWNQGCDLGCQNTSGLTIDAFPNNAAASMDNDSDNAPDAWNVPNPYGCTAQDAHCNGLTLDNCTLVANPLQQDLDQDGYGNACDGDVVTDADTHKVNNADILAFINAASYPGSYINVQPDPSQPMITVPRINKLSEINQGALYEWIQNPDYVPGPSALSCAGSIPCP